MTDWINYEEDPAADDTRHWSHGAFHKYWYELFTKKHKRKPRWGVKETTLLTRLIREYKSEDLKRMMEVFVNEGPGEFNMFYSIASHYHEKIKDWEW